MDHSLEFNDFYENRDISLENEAEKYCREINFGVKFVKVSDKLDKNNSVCYLNITTLENQNWCIELNNQGFSIVSNIFDKKDDMSRDYLSKFNISSKQFETIESLMFTISPLYSQRFNEMMMSNYFKKIKTDRTLQNEEYFKNENLSSALNTQTIQIYKFSEDTDNKDKDYSMIIDDEVSINSDISVNSNQSNKISRPDLLMPKISNVDEIFQFLSQKIAKYCQVLADLTNCEVFYKAQLPLNTDQIATENNYSNKIKSQESSRKISSVYWGTHQMLFQYSHGKGIKYNKENGDCLIRINHRSLTNDVNNLIEEILNEPNVERKVIDQKKTIIGSDNSEIRFKDLNILEHQIDNLLEKPINDINFRDCFIALNRIDENETDMHLDNFEKKNNKINLDTNKHEFFQELNLPEEEEDLYCDKSQIEFQENQEKDDNKKQNLKNVFLSNLENSCRFEEIFKCDICKNCHFRHLTQLKIHELRVHHNIQIEQNNNECPKCKLKCNDSYISFIKHLIKCYYPNLFTCKICKCQFDTYSKFLFHLKYIHTNYIYCCSVCGRNFKLLRELIDHEKLMHTKDNFFCEICMEKLNTKKCLFEHYKNKHLNKSESTHNHLSQEKMNSSVVKLYNGFKDSSIAKSSSSEHKNQSKQLFQNEFEAGQMSQESEYQTINVNESKSYNIQKNDLIRGLIDRKHQCKWCMLRFYTKSQLKQHEAVHTNSVLYCPICDKQFNHKDRLSGHMKCHMEPSLECKVCGKKFKRLCNLYNHELVHGLTEHAFMLCQFCGRGFRSRRDYQNHVIANHRDQLIKSDSKISDEKDDIS